MKNLLLNLLQPEENKRPDIENIFQMKEYTKLFYGNELENIKKVFEKENEQ